MIKKILIFTRPWEVRFHIALGKQLGELLNVPVEFATFFSKAKNIIESEGQICSHIYYMPELLLQVNLGKWDNEYFIDMDRKFQTEIGANFNLMINAERFLPKDEKLAEDFYRRHFLVLDSIIEDGTLTLTSFIDHYVYWLASAMAWVKGGCHFAHCTVGMPPNYSVFYKHPMETWKRELAFEDSERIKEYSIQKLTVPTMKRVDYAITTPRPGMLKRFRHTLREIHFEKIDEKHESYFQYYAPIKSRLFGHVENTLKSLVPKRKRVYDINTIDELPEKFIYYPLHFEPEATILMLSPYFRDQIEASRIMAQSLPVGTKLVVKDHPQMYTRRDSSYYERLRSIPNVLLCSPLIEGKVLTDRCSGLVSLSGTAAIEASLLGKNNLCIGWPPFRYSLQYQNFSKDNNLSDMYSIFKAWSENPIVEYNPHTWNDWCSRLCEVSLVPKNNGFEYEITDVEEKTKVVLQYIHECLVYEGLLSK